MFVLVAGVNFAHADEKQPDETRVQAPKTPDEVTKHINSTQVGPDESTNSTLMMKIQSDEKGDQEKRKEFIEELRKLYKANFL